MFSTVCHVIEVALLVVLIWRPLRLKMAHDVEEMAPKPAPKTGHPAIQLLLYRGDQLIAEQTVHRAHRPLEVICGGFTYMSTGKYDHIKSGWVYQRVTNG